MYVQLSCLFAFSLIKTTCPWTHIAQYLYVLYVQFYLTSHNITDTCMYVVCVTETVCMYMYACCHCGSCVVRKGLWYYGISVLCRLGGE